MIGLTCWSFWQEIGTSYFPLENAPKGGPLEDFFTFSLFFFYLFITSPPLTRIIQPHKFVFVYTDTLGPPSCITSAILIIRQSLFLLLFLFLSELSFILIIFVYICVYQGSNGGAHWFLMWHFPRRGLYQCFMPDYARKCWTWTSTLIMVPINFW